MAADTIPTAGQNTPFPGGCTCWLLLALLLLGLLHGEEDPHAAERHHPPVGQGDYG